MLRILSSDSLSVRLLLLLRETSKGITLWSVSWCTITIKSVLLLIDREHRGSGVASHGLWSRLILRLLHGWLSKALEAIATLVVVSIFLIVSWESLELLLLLILLLLRHLRLLRIGNLRI